MKIFQTAERISQENLSDNFVFQRQVFAYKETANIVSGKVLEIGTGSGYGIRHIAPKCDKLITIDKFKNEKIIEEYSNQNITFLNFNVPPFKGISDNSIDYVFSFQVIEHIKRDLDFLSEIHRVLKPGGKCIITTPNKVMSLTRNPWHIREYTVAEMEVLMKKKFDKLKKRGVFGNEKVRECYFQNKEGVRKITRFDIFNFQHILPRQLLQIPYDILNRVNRKKLLNQNDLVKSIVMEDYYIDKATDRCYDLFFIAEKE